MKFLVLCTILAFTLTGCSDGDLSEADQRRLETTLRKLDAKITRGQIDEPAGDNALTELQRAQDLAPAHEFVLERIRVIAGFYEADARDSLDGNKPYEALEAIRKGLEINPGFDALVKLEIEAESMLSEHQRAKDERPRKEGTYKRDYLIAIKALENGDLGIARKRLISAIAGNDRENAKIKIYGMRFDSYLPHYYLGQVEYLDGNCEQALVHWENSVQQGVILGQGEYDELLHGADACGAADIVAAWPGNRTHGVKGETATVLREPKEGTKKDREPWVEDYAKALQALENQEPSTARSLLMSAIGQNDKAAARIRIYGMRFGPYLPYFYLGKLEYLDGNCDKAIEHWKTSLAQPAVQQNDELKNFIQAEAGQHLLTGECMGRAE